MRRREEGCQNQTLHINSLSLWQAFWREFIGIKMLRAVYRLIKCTLLTVSCRLRRRCPSQLNTIDSLNKQRFSNFFPLKSLSAAHHSLPSQSNDRVRSTSVINSSMSSPISFLLESLTAFVCRTFVSGDRNIHLEPPIEVVHSKTQSALLKIQHAAIRWRFDTGQGRLIWCCHCLTYHYHYPVYSVYIILYTPTIYM